MRNRLTFKVWRFDNSHLSLHYLHVRCAGERRYIPRTQHIPIDFPTIMNSTNRQEIDLKLIALIKPHKILYDGRKHAKQDRAKLWTAICAEMNNTFDMNRGK